MSVRRCSDRHCGGVLLPEWGDFKMCPTCRENHAQKAARYRATKNGRDASRKLRRESHRRHAERENRERRELRLANKLNGICVDCSDLAASGSDYCVKHRDSHRAAALAWYHRSKPSPGATLKRRAKRIARVTTIGTRPVGRVEETPPREPKLWQRVLRVVSRFDEVTNADVSDVLGFDEARSNSLSHIFGRLVRRGYLQRIRGQGSSSDTAYVVTPEGRKAA